MDLDEYHEGREFRKLFSKEIRNGKEIRIGRLRIVYSGHGGMHRNIGTEW